MAVYVRDLSVWFGNQRILTDINLQFKRGKISAIVGPSGCGKSTLLRTITRSAELEREFHHKGQVFVNNDDIYQCRDATIIRRKLGLVLQQPVALPLSIKENVLFGVKYYQRKSKGELNLLAEKYLRQTGLWEEVKNKLHCPASQLSGGQKQRLSIARVLAVEPEVLLLDEPCSSLDPTSTNQIEKLLLDLSQKVTIAIVTHNLFQAQRVAHDTFFILNGQLVESGPTEEFFSRPTEQQTKDFIAGLTW